ncbi:MAG: Do family serine endopeptidase [Burkholderiaceae bacterium]|jgi:serine protease DegQ|nr:Do family serine endopeptidase [Burkholderiaceae bacterium]MDH5210025.1 Do family serine endopeptidase [Burkholderiaceae bacterium]
MLRRLWLIFAQATTVGLALLFIVSTLRPEWIGRSQGPSPVVTPAGVAIRQGTAPDATRASALTSYADAVKHAAPAVVNVYTTKEVRRRGAADDPLYRYFFGDPRGGTDRVASLGSGVIASADGYVLTNNHVVQAADEIAVALSDGRQLEARLVGADPESDLAVLKIDARDLPAITFGRSDSLKVGDVVLAIGNPFDVGQTVTMGIVSALGRTDLGINTFENFIQTDAAINQGNSGGALVDSNGHLVGINSAIFSRSGGSVGIGFAIPSTLAVQVMDQLIKTGKVVRGFFGVEPEDLTPDLAEVLKLPRSEGVVLRAVQRSGPAGKAGLEPGDVMLTINGQPVQNRRAMLNQISQLPPGTAAKVRVSREGKEVELQVTVGERPQPQLPRAP